MPHGLPAASATTKACYGIPDDGHRVHIPASSHVEIIARCADQDGWNGEIAVRFQGKILAVAPDALRLFKQL